MFISGAGVMFAVLLRFVIIITRPYVGSSHLSLSGLMLVGGDIFSPSYALSSHIELMSFIGLDIVYFEH